MLIILQDCFVEARIDEDNPSRVTLRSRQRGDIERFAGSVEVTVSSSADFEFRAVISRAIFDQSLKRAADNMTTASFVESVAARDLRRRENYRDISAVMSANLGAFGLPGSLDGLNPGYPPDFGLPDDADVARFLKED